MDGNSIGPTISYVDIQYVHFTHRKRKLIIVTLLGSQFVVTDTPNG